MRTMIKFWKEDFEYVSRFGSDRNYIYEFYVRGESANYLMNRYKLKNGRIYTSFSWPEKSFLITNRNRNDIIENAHIGDDEDREELYEAVKDQIDADLRNYEEYMCDDWYHRDSRWK